MFGAGAWAWLGAAAWALVAVATVSVVVAAFRASFGYDESYNLQVVTNLVHGHGYATDGLMYGDGTRREAFDPAITTGPTLLLPIGAVVMVLGEHPWVYRLVPVAFYGLLLVAWGRHGRVVAGRPGMFAALAGVLVVNTCAATVPGSPLFGAGDALGEVSAAALVVLATLDLQRPGRAGLLLGLAVMSKLLALVTFPAVLVGVLLAPASIRTRLLRALVFGGGVALPAAAWQVCRVVTLGPHLAWTRNVEFWQRFRTMGSGLGASGPHDPAHRLHGQLPMLGGFGFLLLVVALVVIACCAIGTRRDTWRRTQPVLVLVAAGASLQVWWTFFAGFSNARFTAILTYLLLPGVIVLATALVRDQRTPRLSVVGSSLLAGSAVLAVVASAHSTRAPAGSRLDEQNEAVRFLQRQGVASYRIDHWQVPELALLSGLPERRLDKSGGLLALSDWAKLNAPSAWRSDRARCSSVLARVDDYLFCRVDPAQDDTRGSG